MAGGGGGGGMWALGEAAVASVASLGPATYSRVRDGVALALSLASAGRRRRASVSAAQLEVAIWVAHTRPVDLSSLLPDEVLFHICHFLDGEGNHCLSFFPQFIPLLMMPVSFH